MSRLMGSLAVAAALSACGAEPRGNEGQSTPVPVARGLAVDLREEGAWEIGLEAALEGTLDEVAVVDAEGETVTLPEWLAELDAALLAELEGGLGKLWALVGPGDVESWQPYIGWCLLHDPDVQVWLARRPNLLCDAICTEYRPRVVVCMPYCRDPRDELLRWPVMAESPSRPGEVPNGHEAATDPPADNPERGRLGAEPHDEAAGNGGPPASPEPPPESSTPVPED